MPEDTKAYIKSKSCFAGSTCKNDNDNANDNLLSLQALQTLTKTPWNRSGPFPIPLAENGGHASQSVVFVTCKRHRSTVHKAFIDNFRSICGSSRIIALNNYVEKGGEHRGN